MQMLDRFWHRQKKVLDREAAAVRRSKAAREDLRQSAFPRRTPLRVGTNHVILINSRREAGTAAQYTHNHEQLDVNVIVTIQGISMISEFILNLERV